MKLGILPCEISSQNIIKHTLCNVKDEVKAYNVLDDLCNKLENNYGVEIYEKDIIPAVDKVPDKLYIYRSWSESQKCRTKEILENHQLYLADPLSFNDPFDCQMQIYTPNYDINDFSANVGIRCFSATYNNILMWSHYADGHRGLCIEFDAKELLKRDFGEIIKVRYRKNMPKFLEISDIDLKRALCYKYEDWKYEQEYRLLHGHRKGTKFKFPPCAITSIYIGCKMSEEYKKQITTFVSYVNELHDINVKTINMHADTQNFGLEVSDIY